MSQNCWGALAQMTSLCYLSEENLRLFSLFFPTISIAAASEISKNVYMSDGLGRKYIYAHVGMTRAE